MAKEISNDFVVTTLDGEMTLGEIVATIPPVFTLKTPWSFNPSLVFLPEGESFNTSTLDMSVLYLSYDPDCGTHKWEFHDEEAKGQGETWEDCVKAAVTYWNDRINPKNRG